jgi:hypothetical protein
MKRERDEPKSTIKKIELGMRDHNCLRKFLY